MSGPKGVRYAVVSKAELRRRAADAAKGRLSMAEGRWEAVTNAVARTQADVGSVVSTPSLWSARHSGRDAEAIDRAARDLLKRCEEAESTLRAELAAARTVALAQRLAQIAETATTTSSRTAPMSAVPRREPAPAKVSEGRAHREESVRRQLARLDPDAADEARERLVGLAASVLSADDDTADLLLTSLRDRVQKVNRSAEQRRTARAWAAELTARLLLLELVETATLRADLAVAAEGDDVTGRVRALEEAVEAAEDQQLRERDRRFTADALEKSLAALGYEAEESFVTMLVRDGTAHVRAESWESHAVRVRLPADGERLGFNVVRHGPEAAAADDQDIEAERTWCTDFGGLDSLMQAHGVETELVRSQPPGALPVQVVGSQAVAFADRRRRASGTGAERGRR